MWDTSIYTFLMQNEGETFTFLFNNFLRNANLIHMYMNMNNYQPEIDQILIWFLVI